jgi:hypothetical protein
LSIGKKGAPTRPKAAGLDNQIHRARVLEVRIHFPPAKSHERTMRLSAKRHFRGHLAVSNGSKIRRVGGGLRSSETQRQFVCAGTAVLHRLRYDLLGGAGERETRDEFRK